MTHRERRSEEQRAKMWNSEILRNEETRGRFEKAMEDKLRTNNWSQEEGIECLWERLKTSIIQTAEEILGEKPRGSRDQWFDEECREVIEHKNARERLISNGMRGRMEEYREARRKAKDLLRKKKRTFYREKLKHLEQKCHYGRKNGNRKFFREVKEVKASYTPQCKFIRTSDGTLATDQETIMQKWVEHFTSAFTNEESSLEEVQPAKQEEENLKLMPSADDVTAAVRTLKNNKAPGIDAITGEMLKNTGNTADEILHRIVKIIWQAGETPPGDWATGIINPIPKKGDLTVCQNYKAITLLCTAYKVTA